MYSQGFTYPKSEGILKAKGLVYFDELDQCAKMNAIDNVIKSDIEHYKNQLNKAKRHLKTSLNYCINDKYFIKKLVDRQKHIKSIIQNESKAVSYIRANLCMFYKNGVYFEFYKSGTFKGP